MYGCFASLGGTGANLGLWTWWLLLLVTQTQISFTYYFFFELITFEMKEKWSSTYKGNPPHRRKCSARTFPRTNPRTAETFSNE